MCLIIQLYGGRAGSKRHPCWLPLCWSFHWIILLQHMPSLLEGIIHQRWWLFRLIIKTVVLFMKGSLPAICVLLKGHKLCSLKWHKMQQENALHNRKSNKIISLLGFPPLKNRAFDKGLPEGCLFWEVILRNRIKGNGETKMGKEQVNPWVHCWVDSRIVNNWDSAH